MEAAVTTRRFPSRTLAGFFASLGFLVFAVGATYFALLVLAVNSREAASERAVAYYELARYLSGELEWYLDARLYGGVSFLCALISLLFGNHRLARVTLILAGSAFLGLVLFQNELWKVITSWAKTR